MILQLVVHNHYLLVAAQMGIPALLFWCYLLYRMARQAWPVSRWGDPGAMALGIGLGCAVISQMLFLASDNYDADIRVFLLWLTVGLLQALTRLRPVSGPAPISQGRP
jgi:O-antigen ligase